MAGLFKLVLGIAIGAGIAYAVSKRSEQQEDDPFAVYEGESSPLAGIKARIADASSMARSAREEREEELRNLFRRRTADPLAFAETETEPSGG